MLTTAVPCSSTRRVKSGSSRACARRGQAEQSQTTERQGRFCCSHRFVSSSPDAYCGYGRILDRVGDALHARRRRLADHGNHVIRHFAGIDVDRALLARPVRTGSRRGLRATR